MRDVSEVASPRRAIARVRTLVRRAYDLADELASEGFEDLAEPLGEHAYELSQMCDEARKALAEGRVYLS